MFFFQISYIMYHHHLQSTNIFLFVVFLIKFNKKCEILSKNEYFSHKKVHYRWYNTNTKQEKKNEKESKKTACQTAVLTISCIAYAHTNSLFRSCYCLQYFKKKK